MKCVRFLQNVDERIKVKRMNKQLMEIMQTGVGQKNNHLVIEYDSMYFFFKTPHVMPLSILSNQVMKSLVMMSRTRVFCSAPFVAMLGTFF